jgi:hypothetical protein
MMRSTASAWAGTLTVAGCTISVHESVPHTCTAAHAMQRTTLRSASGMHALGRRLEGIGVQRVGRVAQS